jgi:hypothetical protein
MLTALTTLTAGMVRPVMEFDEGRSFKRWAL